IGRRGNYRRCEMEGIRLPSQAGRSKPPAAVRRAVSTADRLANLVRSDGVARGISLDAAFCLETSAQRSRHALAPGEQSLSRRAASLHPRAALSLSVHSAWRERMVETRTNQRMAARAFNGRSTVSAVARRDGLARLEHEVCPNGQREFS